MRGKWSVGLWMSCLCGLLVVGMTATALGAPSLPVSKPPVQPYTLETGPSPTDPTSASGQWFRDLDGQEEFRSHEFYDNVLDHGGGWASSRAIQGHVTDITYGATSANIVAFKVLATITNDLPGVGEWADGTNSHEESLTWREQYYGPLFAAKMAAEFAIADTATLPSFTPGTPYRKTDPFIIAENEDQYAWYCYSNLPAGGLPEGDYYVPVWDFGDIDEGASASVTMEFRVDGAGLDPTDPRYAVIEWSYQMGSESDILLNRTTSLKVSTWIDDPAVDDGSPYPGGADEPPLRSSNASVFHNIAPIYYTLDLWFKNPSYGTWTVTPDWVAYPPGYNVVLQAFPNSGKSFKEWTLYDPNYPGDANYATYDTSNPVIVVMMDDREVQGAFKCGSSGMLLPLGMALLALTIGAVIRRIM